MHMADALISPAVGGTMIVATVGAAAWSIRKLRLDPDERKIPLMGVMGAFVFAAQMINFSIPGTGSSGHIGGGLLLAALLGPWQGFLTMASILLIQALFFGDGGLLAFGCNVFNLGFFTCLLAYPLIYRWMTRKGLTAKRIFGASMVSAIFGLQLGSFSVVLETVFSGKTELPFSTFVLLMQPIHLAIGVVEGLVTAAVVTFVWRNRPEILESTINVASSNSGGNVLRGMSMRKVLAILGISAALIGGVLSWFASSNPDGLEWAMFRTSGTTELESGGNFHSALADIQQQTAILPDYAFPSDENPKVNADSETPSSEETTAWPAVDPGTSVSGLVGGALTLLLAILLGLGISLLKRFRAKTAV